VNVGQSFFSMSEAYNKSKIIEAESKLNQTLAGIEARAMERQAIGVENQGVRAAMIEQQKTKMVSSDAVAMMAAGGGGVDPEMLAKIKQRGDYNSMTAIFDARTRAIDLRYQAEMTRIGSRMDAGASQRYGDSLKREATTGAIFNSMDMFAQAYKPAAKTTKSPGTFRKSANKSVGGKGYVGGF
jgi:hypothetical protein